MVPDFIYDKYHLSRNWTADDKKAARIWSNWHLKYKRMPYKRKRGFGWSRRKRRRVGFRSSTFGGSYSKFRIRRGKTRGFYRKKAFGGSRRWTASKLSRCIESKMVQVIAPTNSITILNGAVTTTREYNFSPFQSIIQGTGLGNFTGTCIWFKGCWLQFFVSSIAAQTDTFFIQLDCFRTDDDVDYQAAAPWSQRTDTGTEIADHFYDRVYGATSTTTDGENFLAPPNQRGGGPTCIFRKTMKLNPHVVTPGGNALKVSVYIPLNQLVRFKHQLASTDLTTAPNFWEHGTPVFILKYWNAAPGAVNSLLISGTMARMYFKDS